jgi:hypothetical protein
LLSDSSGRRIRHPRETSRFVPLPRRIPSIPFHLYSHFLDNASIIIVVAIMTRDLQPSRAMFRVAISTVSRERVAREPRESEIRSLVLRSRRRKLGGSTGPCEGDTFTVAAT